MKILIVFVLSILVLGFSCKEDHVEQPFDITYVEGVILDSLTNDPLNEVEISLFKSTFLTVAYPVRKAYSDQYGKFKIDYVTEKESLRSYYLQFSKSGYYYSYPYLNLEIGKKQTVKIKLLKN